MNLARFQGKLAVVTGAGSGIGAAVSLAIAGEGAEVVLVGRRRGPLEAVASQIRHGGGTAQVHPADVDNPDDLHRLAESALVGRDGLDVLVHGAGVIETGLLSELPVESLDRQYRTNCRGPYLLTRLLLPSLIRATGQVVLVNSSAGLNARGGVAAYAATKHAARAFADALRDEVNRQGVRVLSVYCGRTATPMQHAIQEKEGRPYRPDRLIQPGDVASVIVHALGLPRTAEVTDVQIRPMLPPE